MGWYDALKGWHGGMRTSRGLRLLKRDGRFGNDWLLGDLDDLVVHPTKFRKRSDGATGRGEAVGDNWSRDHVASEWHGGEAGRRGRRDARVGRRMQDDDLTEKSQARANGGRGDDVLRPFRGRNRSVPD